MQRKCRAAQSGVDATQYHRPTHWMVRRICACCRRSVIC